MATSTTELILKFTGDERNLKETLARVRADLSRSAQAQVTSAKEAGRQVTAEAKSQTRTLEREERQRKSAAESLQRQKSAALIAEWKRLEREAARSAKQIADSQIREARRAADGQLREAKRWAGITQQGAGATSSLLAGAAGGVAALLGVSAISEIRQAGQAWFEYSSKLEATRIAFTTMLGSAEAASAHLKELQQFALTTPFEFSDLIDASQRMQALGFEAKQVVPVLTDVGNAVAAAGGGSERLDRVVLALSQIQSKGKVATQEMNQLAEAGIPAWKILEQQFGKSRAELVKLVEAGRISSAVFLEAFQRFSQNNFGGLMEKQSKTALGALSNIKDAVLQLSNSAFEPLFTMISNGLNAVAQNLQTNQSSWEEWGRKISTSVANNVAGIIVLIRELRNLDRQIGETLSLPSLTKELEKFADDFDKQQNQTIVAAIALLNSIRGLRPVQRSGDEGEFAIAGVPLNVRGEPTGGTPLSTTRTTELLGEEKKAKGADPAATAQRIAELTLANTIAGLNAEEAAIRQSLARREVSFEEYAAKLTLLESARHVKVVTGLQVEAEEAAKLRKSNQRTIQLKEIENKLQQENNRHTEFGNKLEDQRIDITRQVNDFIQAQNKDVAEAITKTGVFQQKVLELIKSLADQGVALSKTQEHWLRFNATLADSIERMKRMFELMRESADTVPIPGGKIPKLTPQQEEGNILTPEQQRQIGAPPLPDLNALIGLATQAGGVFAGLGTIISDTFNLGTSGAVAFAETLSSAFGQVASAVGDAVHAFVLFGTVEGGFKKFVAETIASLAAMAAVQALYQAAQGLAWLALNFFFPNPAYAKAAATAFASAAAFGLIAGVTIPLGRALAGNSFQKEGAGSGSGGGGRSTSGGSSSTATTTQPATQEFDRRVSNQQAIARELTFKVKGDVVIDKFVEDFNLNGRTRITIMSEQ